MTLDHVDQLTASGPLVLAMLVSVVAGFVSFASPCVVPLVPGYLSYLAAVVGVEEQPGRAHRGSGVAVRTARLRVAGAALLFVAGFTAVFLLGTVAVLGMTTTLITNQLLLQRIGGVITIVMGLVFVGFIPALQREARFTPRQVSTLGGAPLLGAVFGLGWTPCLGPTLTGVIAVASATDGASVARGVALGHRLLPGAGNPVRAVGLWLRPRGAGPWLAAPAHPRHPDLRRRAADPRRRCAGDRAVERLRVLGARRVRQRRQIAHLMTALVRNTWRTLTSMGTALVLLFLLALGAIPGALLPQRSLNEFKVEQYIAEHPTIGPWLDRLQAFEVFSSFWFTAIYVLLFISLVGCLTPRLIEHARSLRATPVAAPRNLSRLPKHHTAEVSGDPDAVAAAVSDHLRGWRRTVRKQEDQTTEISAEKGYLREFGNIVFHFSLLGLLVAVAAGKLFGYEGNVIVIADSGPGFCSASPAAFDSFRAGNTVDGTSLYPICLRVNDFQAHYLPTGQAVSFAANINYQAGSDLNTDTWRPYHLKVNEPLRVGGDRVYLQGHGYAPTFTVTFPDGQTRTQTLQFRPEDQITFLSSGAMRFDPPGGSYPDPDERRKNQIAIQGLFAPTEQLDGTLLSSSFPALNNPAVAVDIYKGDTGLDTGRPQSLFSLDPKLIEQKRLTKKARVNLRAGQDTRLDDGTIVRFDGAVPFINVQVSHDPAQVWVLVFALTMMAGLLVSLVVRRRRVWVRLTPAGPGTVSVELGGLARTDNSGWGDEFERLTQRLFPCPRAEAPPGR